MDSKIEKIKEEIKNILDETSKDVSNEYILKSLIERLDSVGKIDELYKNRLTELVEEQRQNNKLENDIKIIETNIALHKS